MIPLPWIFDVPILYFAMVLFCVKSVCIHVHPRGLVARVHVLEKIKLPKYLLVEFQDTERLALGQDVI